MTPRVTVLMPVYNASAYLQQAVDSILTQTFSDFEFLIINDGSTDSSDSIIRSYKDPRIKYVINDTNLKLIATLNKGVEMAIGEYIVRMDADDISEPDRLAILVEKMDAEPGVGVCGSWFETFGQRDKVTRYETQSDLIRLNMLYQCHLCHPSVIIRRKVLIDNLLFYNNEYIHAEDYDLWVRIGAFTKYANIPEVLLKYRAHAESVSNKFSNIQLENLQKINVLAFKQLGVEITHRQLALYHKLMYGDFTCQEFDIEELNGLINRMLEANKQTTFVEQRVLISYLATKWQHLLYNSPISGKVMRKFYFYGPLAAYMQNKTKAFLKSIFKK